MSVLETATEEDISLVKQQLKNAMMTIDALQKDIEESGSTINNLQSRIYNFEAEKHRFMVSCEEKIEALKAEISQLKKEKE